MIIFYKRRQGVVFLRKMWLLVLLVLKLKHFLPEAAILRNYSLVTCLLLLNGAFQLKKKLIWTSMLPFCLKDGICGSICEVYGR